MKTTALTVAILGMLTTGSVFAQAGESSTGAFEGSRIGAGLSQTEVKSEFKFESDNALNFDYDFDYGDGYKLEYGYDFSRVVGVGASYETNTGTIPELEWVDVDASTIKLSIDLGYAFSIYSFYLKPYAKVGYKFFLDDTTGWVTEEYNSDDFFYGAGLRLQYSAIYAGFTIDRFSTDFTTDDELAHIDYHYTQMGVTVGYKF